MYCLTKTILFLNSTYVALIEWFLYLENDLLKKKIF